MASWPIVPQASSFATSVLEEPPAPVKEFPPPGSNINGTRKRAAPALIGRQSCFGTALLQGAADHGGQFQGREGFAQENKAGVELEFLVDKDFVVAAGEQETDRRFPLPDLVVDLAGTFLRQDRVEQDQINLVR